MTEKQNEYHQQDVRAVAQGLIDQANARGWGNMVPGIFDQMNEKLTVKLPTPVRVDRVSTYSSFSFEAPEGSEKWNQKAGAEWFNDMFAKLEAAFPGIKINRINGYDWDRQAGQYKLPETDAPAVEVEAEVQP